MDSLAWLGRLPADPTPCLRPLAGATVAAGFPNPAEDFLDRELDLTAHCVRHPASTYFWRVSGNSMVGVGIHHGALLVVDCSVKAVDGSIVVAVVDGEHVCKRLRFRRDGRPLLVAESPGYPDLSPAEFVVWGVATFVVRSLWPC